jgi:hypothetical protein
MPNKFVLDASLFEKYSSDEQNSIDIVFQKLIDSGKCSWTISKELNSFMELLEAVTEGKAIICRSEGVIQEYTSFINKIPPEILEYVLTILSDDNCSVEIEKGEFQGDDSREIKDTELGSKEIYLDIATALKKRVIVST